MVSKFVTNELSKVVDKDKNYHLSKRPHDKPIIEGVMGGFYYEIEKRKEGKKI